MKNISFTILVAAAVLGLGLYFREVGTAHSIKSELASTRQKNAELQARAMEAESRVKTLEIRLKESRTRAAEEAGEAARLQRTLATTSAASKASTASGQGPQTNKANSMAAMFKNPEMRDFIKNQQKTVLGPMITKNYGPFITGLNLTPDQAQGLKDLLVKKALAGADAGLSIMSGDLDPAKRDEIMQQAKSEKDAVDQEIKSYLGDDIYPEFQSYEKTLPERTALNSFVEQQAGQGVNLTDDQQSQLLAAMSQERGNFKYSSGLDDQSKISADPQKFLTEENIERFVQDQDKLNQQYLGRAQGILTSDQLAAFQKFLDNQRDLAKMGMSMAAKMFGSK